ncbi:DVUA0089 family protein [Candidatus Bipolaricaulota bacterium]|nr:DVUA0089 family protein [Candidatus Bipolaricaulota bacterium]
MRTQCFGTVVIIVLLLGFALPLAAQSDPVFLGAFFEPFTTLTVTGELTHPGELDWYSFEVIDNDSTLFILVEGTDGEYGIRVLLFDNEDNYIDATEDRLLRATLAAGTYRIRIDSIESGVQGYSLVVLNGVEIESNDGLLEANDLGEVTGRVLLFASLVPPGDADFFGFEIPESGLMGVSNALHVETGGPTSGDTVLILYQYSETEGRYLPIAFDDDSGEGYWSRLLLRPQPGDRYAVRVEETIYPLVGIRDYHLSITPVVLNIDDEPNDTSAKATTLTPTSPDAGTWMADGILDADDTIDFYKLTIESPTLVQIWTESQSDVGDFDTLLTLYTPSGDRLSENDDSGDSLWSRIVVSLDGGDYFVTVEAAGTETALLPYRLRAVAQSVKTMSEAEPNDTDETAELIEWSDGEALLIEAAIGLESDIDSFRFVLSEETTIVFETRPRSGSTEGYDTTLTIYDEDLWEVAYNDDADGSWSRIEATLAAGTYYVIVESFYSDESFEYTLLITVP